MLLELVQQATDTLTGNPVLARDTFAPRKQSLGFANLNNEVPSLLAPHDSRNQVSDLITKLIVNMFLLKLTQPLLDCLLSRLGGNSAKIRRVHWTLHHVSDLRAFSIQTSLVQMNFPGRVGNRLHHFQ